MSEYTEKKNEAVQKLEAHGVSREWIADIVTGLWQDIVKPIINAEHKKLWRAIYDINERLEGNEPPRENEPPQKNEPSPKIKPHLKPCPLCGEVEGIYSEEVNQPTVWWDSALRGEMCYCISCFECGLSIKDDNEAKLIQKWNELPRKEKEDESR